MIKRENSVEPIPLVRRPSRQYLLMPVHAAIFSLFALTGCNTYDPIVKELDSAYASGEKNEDVTRVVQKYFPKGMKIEAAYKQLSLLKQEGFSIGEYRHDRARQWPHGDLRLYSKTDEATRRNLLQRIREGIVEFVAIQKYDWKYLVVEKEAVIRVTTDGNVVLESGGAINITGI